MVGKVEGDKQGEVFTYLCAQRLSRMSQDILFTKAMSFTTAYSRNVRLPVGVNQSGSNEIVAASASEISQQWNARYSHAIPHTNTYYMKCMVGGILSCGLTHAAVTPLDVTKCNMQVTDRVPH